MDRLWSPWRYRYVAKAEPAPGCVFCAKLSQGADAENLILHRGRTCFVILNLYPYATGHMMILPFEHIAQLPGLSVEASHELMDLTRLAVKGLQAVYNPRGFNAGLNLGECAGAGVADHLHMHVLPRWPGDANFMTTVGETRVLPEDLETTYRRLLEWFQREAYSGGSL